MAILQFIFVALFSALAATGIGALAWVYAVYSKKFSPPTSALIGLIMFVPFLALSSFMVFK